MPLLAATILQGLAVVAGLVALIVPGLYVGVRTYCLQAIVVIEPERSSPFAIFGRAWRLSEKDAMPIFLAACLSIVLVIAGVVAATAIAVGLGAIVPALHEPRMRQLVQSALMCFIAPVPPAVMTVLYYDLRIRREGLDLEIGSKSLALEAPPA